MANSRRVFVIGLDSLIENGPAGFERFVDYTVIDSASSSPAPGSSSIVAFRASGINPVGYANDQGSNIISNTFGNGTNGINPVGYAIKLRHDAALNV